MRSSPLSGVNYIAESIARYAASSIASFRNVLALQQVDNFSLLMILPTLASTGSTNREDVRALIFPRMDALVYTLAFLAGLFIVILTLFSALSAFVRVASRSMRDGKSDFQP